MFEDFKKVNQQDWLEKATSDLKGENPLDKFSWQKGSLGLKPYYDLEDIKGLEYLEKFNNRLALDNDPSGEPRVWSNIQRVIVKNEKEANSTALNGLQNGADGIEFIIDSSTLDFELLLTEIKTEYCELHFVLNNDHLAESAIEYLNDNHPDPKLIRIESSFQKETLLLKLLSNIKTNIKLISLKVKSDEDPINEISALLLKANKIIRSLINKGVESRKVNDSIFLSTDIGTDFFIEIAKVKALRMLFFQLAHAYDYVDFSPEDLYIQCNSPAWENENYGPHENMLKSSTAAMASILGECNSLLIEPENGSEHASRIARNVSSILKEESYLSKVADPVAGSYYIEYLINDIAQKSWKTFQNNVELEEESK